MTIHFYGRIVEVLLMIGNFFSKLRIRFCNGISFAELCELYVKWRQLSHWGRCNFDIEVAYRICEARDNLVHRVYCLQIQPSMLFRSPGLITHSTSNW